MIEPPTTSWPTILHMRLKSIDVFLLITKRFFIALRLIIKLNLPMSKSRYLFLFSIYLLMPFSLYAQFMDYGSDPSRFKWNIARLPHYDLVYPQGTDSMAYRYALYLENAYPHIQKTIGKPMKAKFPVILHPGNMSSNGMVSWAPRRMELITTPSSDLGIQSWDKHLVLHESRHIFQTGKVMHGIFKPFYYLIGEQAAGVATFFLPAWFLEGDAVSTETAMSNGGRGRLPEFNMPYRTQMLGSDKFYSFDKWLLGSYKNYTGTYYALGYDLASYARQRYGGDIWDKTTSRYVNNILFEGSFKHFTGSSFKRLYNDTFEYLRSEWKKQDSCTITPTYHSPAVKAYTSYRYPLAINDSVVIAVKSSMKDINSLVMFTNGKEKRLSYIGNINSRTDFRNNRIYWTEIVPGLRWTHENYSVLKCYDLDKDRITILTPRQRYLTPSVDKSGKVAAVSRNTIAGKNQLVLVNLEDGKELISFDTPGNAFVKELAFGDDDTVIAVAVTDTGISLFRFSPSSAQWEELLKTISANINSPVQKDGKIYFESGANGINNIYCFDPASNQVHRQTAARFGAFDPSFPKSGQQLFFADYQADGYRVASLSIDSLLSEKTDFSKPSSLPFVETLAAQEQFNLDSARLEAVPFHPKRYRKGLHTFKIHSWAPFYYDVAEAMNTGASDLSTIVKPGATIMSQNTLNTAIMQAGWYYHKGYHHGKLSFTYQGWFPVINLTADYGDKAFNMAWTKNDQEQDVTKGYYTGRNLLEAEAQIYLPFNLTRNQQIRGIQPALIYYFTNNKYQEYGSQKFRNFQYILPEILFYNYRRKAQRDILPRTGYQLRLQYLMTPFNTENYGSLYAARLTTYWPGIIRNHGLMLRFGYQYQDLDGKALYLPKHLLEEPRGYNFQYQTRQQWAFKADYALPIFSPDLSIGPLIYIRRLRANLFYDLSRNQTSRKSLWTTQSSCGADFIFDWNVLRMTYPLTTGVRLIQPINYGKFQAEMLFSISF